MVKITMLFIKGKKKIIYSTRDVKNRDHGQTFDDAEICWDYLFSGTRRRQMDPLNIWKLLKKEKEIGSIIQ